MKPSRLFGKCPSCGTNFSSHKNLVEVCAELQKLKDLDRPNPDGEAFSDNKPWTADRWAQLYTKSENARQEMWKELQKFKPIQCKDRMPTKENYPILIYVPTLKRWFLENHEVEVNGEFWWMLMPPKPE